MNKSLNIVLLIVIFIGILVATGAVYTIDETKQVVVTQFGQLIGKPKKAAGLYFKFPWQTANYFDKRILIWDGDANQIPTVEKRYIWVDATARWRIVDPLKFMQSVGNENSAQSRLDDIIDASTRDIIASNRLVEAVRNTDRLLEERKTMVIEQGDEEFGKTALESIKFGREELSQRILQRAASKMSDLGIELVDVRIKRINYVREVQNKVYQRMISERNRAAEKFRSEGQGKKAQIEGLMGKELELIQSEAYKTAQEIIGKADAEAIKIYADAYNKDPEFYSFIKTLDTYKKTVGTSTTLILSTDNEFYNQLNDSGLGI